MSAEKMTLFYDRDFPRRFGKSGASHRAILGIGGNIGNVRRRFAKLVHYLRQGGRVDPVESSPILKNPPFGYVDQPDFYNAVLTIRTDLDPFTLLRYLLFVEKRFKRVRHFKNGPRTLDIDILFYDDLHLHTRRLTLPHPRWRERESVLIPLAFLHREER